LHIHNIYGRLVHRLFMLILLVLRTATDSSFE